MKSFSGKTILFIFLVALAAIYTTACSDDPIFSAIEAEVKLKDPSVRGTVISLVNQDGDLYTANGRIYRRTAGIGEWHRIALPSGAYRCSQLAVTQNNGTGEMFGLFQDADWQFHSLQQYTGAGWTPIAGATQGYAIKNGSGFIYFFRQDSITTGENATIETSVYRVTEAGAVSGSVASFTYQSGSGDLPVDGEAGYFATTGGVYDSTGTQLIGGSEPTSGIAGIAVNGADVYAATSGYVYHYTGGAWTRFDHDTTGRVHNLEYLNAGGKHLLLIPCEEGYGEVLLDGSGAPSTYQDPGTTAASSISTSARSQYRSSLADWNILSMFVITNPVPAGDDYVLYAGIIDPEEDGLWSYYSETRQEWKRE